MKLDISSTTRWPNKMSVQEDGLTFSHVFWNQNLYNERYLSIQSIVGKRWKTLTFHHFFHTPSYLNRHLLAFHPFFYWTFRYYFRKFNLNSTLNTYWNREMLNLQRQINWPSAMLGCSCVWIEEGAGSP